MEFKTLLQKHQALLAENKALKEENLSLKARLGLAAPSESRTSQEGVQQDASPLEPSFHLEARANPAEKIRPMPISWRGTLQQYVGRLHRLFENKKEVQVYDYVDIHVRTLEKMYQKRLAGYAAIGYRAKAESIAAEPADIIFDNTNFLIVYHNDMMNAAREAVIISPFVTRRRAFQMLPNMEAALAKRVSVVVVTRPTNVYKDKDRPALEETLGSLKDAGVRLMFKANIHQKFAVIDQKIVWYGSINLLSYGVAQESIMRLESPNIAQELLKDLGKSIST